MKRAMGWVLGMAIFAGAAIWIRAAYFTDEARIRRTLRGLLEDVTFKEGTGNIAKVAKINSFISRFTDDISINVEQVVPLPPLQGRDELHQAMQAALTLLKSCEATLHDVAVEPVPAGAREARAAFTASAVTSKREVELAAQEFEVRLRKNAEGKWLLSRVEAVRTLKR